STGEKIGTLYSAGGFDLPDAELNDRGELYVCNSSFTGPGVAIFSAANDGLIAGPLDVGLPPQVVTFDEPSDQVTGVPLSTPALALSAPWPNPARQSVRFTLDLPHAGPVSAAIFDLTGRLRRRLAAGTRPAGRSELVW